MAEEFQTENSCGDCTVCCMAMGVVEYSKPAGTMCQHNTGKGCGIYETRHAICRGFLCGYRLVPELGDGWRPDRNGVMLVVVKKEEVPEDHRTAGNGMEFIVLGGEKAILRPGFVEYVTTLVSRNVAVYLSADSPKTIINKYLYPHVQAKDKIAVTHMLLHLYRKHIELREIKKWKPQPWIEIA